MFIEIEDSAEKVENPWVLSSSNFISVEIVDIRASGKGGEVSNSDVILKRDEQREACAKGDLVWRDELPTYTDRACSNGHLNYRSANIKPSNNSLRWQTSRIN